MQKIEDFMLTERQSHLRLYEPCVFRNAKHRQECRGILAHVLDTTLPDRNTARLCHACNTGECCNPNHMYWGTSSENTKDMYRANPSLAKKISEAMKKR